MGEKYHAICVILLFLSFAVQIMRRIMIRNEDSTRAWMKYNADLMLIMLAALIVAIAFIR